jgi:transcriptional regulator with XRE-family HTH domain
VVNRKKLDPTESAAALFAYKLRRLRDERGLSQIQLADALNCSGDLISKIETCAQAPRIELAKQFDEFFGTGEMFQELQPLVAKEGIPGGFRPYTDLEAPAASIRLFDPLHIAGLLQTEDYARAVLRSRNREDELDTLVAARMARQAILARDDPPWLVVILDERAIRKVIGGPEVMRAQLAHLLELAQRPNITLRVLPDSAAIYPSGKFTVFTFEDDPDVGYVDGAEGFDQPIVHHNQVEKLRILFDRLGAVALSLEDSVTLIKSVMESP